MHIALGLYIQHYMQCLSASVKKTNKFAQMLKHSCYSEEAITRVGPGREANQGFRC